MAFAQRRALTGIASFGWASARLRPMKCGKDCPLPKLTRKFHSAAAVVAMRQTFTPSRSLFRLKQESNIGQKRHRYF